MSISTESPFRVGLLVPSSNTRMETDLFRGLPAHASLHSARMYLVETTPQAEAAMLDDHLSRAVEDLASARPHVTVFGCTSAGALRGPDFDRELCERISNATHAPTISTIQAVNDAIAASGARRIAVLTPYVDDLNVKIRESVEASGSTVLGIEGLGIDDNFLLAEPTPELVAQRAVGLIRRTRPDLLFISCTNFAGLPAVPLIEKSSQTPVITSNMAVLQAIRERMPD